MCPQQFTFTSLLLMSAPLYRFGPYEFGASSGDLRKQGMRIKLQPKPQQVLRALLERAGETVKRQELHARLWPDDTFVDFDQGLNVAIKKLRDALNDSTGAPLYIETVPAVGYRFLVIPEIVNDRGGLAVVSSGLKLVTEESQPHAPGSGLPRNTGRPAVQPKSWVRLFVAAMAFALVVLMVSAFAILRPHTKIQTLRLSLTLPADLKLLTAEGGGGLALSPDGTRIVFPASDPDGKTRLWMRRMDTIDPQSLPGTEGGTFPFWSPDGENIGFFTETRMKRLRLRDGVVREICPAASARGGIWTKEGQIVFAPSTRTALYKVSVDGGIPIPITTLDEKRETTHRWPALLPDGKHFIYLAASHDSANVPAEIYLASLDGSSNDRIVDADSNAVVISDKLIFVSAGKLISSRLDVEHHRAEETVTILAEGVGYDHGSWFGSFATGAQSLVYRPQTSPAVQVIARFDRHGKRLGDLTKPGVYHTVNVSPDGQTIAAACGDPDIGVCLIQRDGAVTRLPGVIGFDAVWSPDSESVAYDIHGQSSLEIRIKNVAKNSSERTIAQSAGVSSWDPDGRHLLIGHDGDIEVLDLMTGERRNYLPRSPHLAHVRISPNRKWVAYDSDESGSQEVYLASYPIASAKYRVSKQGGVGPRWRGDSRELYYLGPGETLLAVPITPDADTVRIGQPQALFQAPVLSSPRDRDCCDVSQDGSQFFVVTDKQPAPSEFVVISHWTQ